MEFAAANIWQDFKTASRTEQGTLDDNGNEVILGPRLNEAVRHLANGYLKRLGLGPETKATDERAKLLDLHWGRIEHDGAQLRGLGAAMTNFAEVLGANVTTLAEAWKGESYDAFAAAIDKVRRTLAEYGEAATVTGDGLVNAMSQVRELYRTFADDSADKHLNFGEVSPPEKWHKVGESEEYSTATLASSCPSDHGNSLVLDVPDLVDVNYDCVKDNDEQTGMVNGRWVTERRWEICKQDGCEESLDRVSIMYTNLVGQCQEAIDRIKGKLDNYFGAVDTTVDGVSQLYDAALGNVFTLANEEVFSSLRVIGGQPAGGDPAAQPTDTGIPVGGGAPVDSGYPSGGGPVAVAEPMPTEPSPEPEPAPEPAPAPADTVAQEPPTAEAPVDQRESMKIKDGDRTIGVASADAEGRILVTVEDGTGTTKTYELDFLAASGLLADQPAGGEPGPDGVVPEQIPARTDGKCVIQDGPLTITAERPLFSPDSITLLVDDGSGKPRTYTLDFEVPEPPQEAQAGTTAGGSPGGMPVDAAHLTSPQGWPGDQSGSVSGVLVPDQPDGEAHLAKTVDAATPDVTGMAGAGLPIMGGPSGGGSEGGGRAGSGWSVHGDLFDNAEPVYSMHGVLGDDEAAE
jgi:hypothetical protein